MYQPMPVPSSFGGAPLRRAGLCGLLLLLLALLGCGGSTAGGDDGNVRIEGRAITRDLQGRLVVLGIDGLPPALLLQAIRDGLVPSFAAIYRDGAFGSVDVTAAGMPPLSPRIWTTYSTGQLPEVHGIRRFVYHGDDGGETLYNSTNRLVPAIWNIATQLGRSIGVVNWWASSPAEAVRGFLISDLYNDVALARLATRLGARIDRDARRVLYPPSLATALRSVTVVDRKIGLSTSRAEEVDGNILELAVVALQEHPVEVLLVYTRAFDELAHVAWGTHEPRPGEEVKSDLILDYLQRYDWLFEHFLREIGPQDHLMILSDHGFERSESTTGLGGTHESDKTTQALLMLKGPRIRSGVMLDPVDVLDVMPTMLELAGLPAAKDMPGKVAAQAFRPGQDRFLPRVDSYELIRSEKDEVEESAGDEAMKERLRALGYIDDGHGGH
jgi:hypothetical protein